MKKSSLVFTGDIGFDNYMNNKWEDSDLISSDILDFVKSGNHVIVNIEGPLLEKEKIPTDSNLKLPHSMNPEAVSFLKKINADIWNICNNHIMDAGPAGIENTIALSARHNAVTLGAGMNLFEAVRPVILDEAGGIGIIGVGYQRACRKASESLPGCFSWSALDLIQESIATIKSKCRWCIIVAHAGEEFTALPSPYTRDRYLKYLEMGADIVVAHHPHVPMNYELFNDKAIFYSLGNFIFDTNYQRSQYNTEYGVLLRIDLTERDFSFVPMGIMIDRTNEHVVSHSLPDIFTNVCKEEYDKLIPLASKMFIENTKRQLNYLFPDKFKNATDEDYYNNFYEPLRSGRVPGECLDFQIIYPLSLEESKKEWQKSTLEDVKKFILRQIPEL